MKEAASRPARLPTARELVLSIDDPKLQYHQKGDDKLPARPLVFGDPLPTVAAAELQQVATDYIEGLLRRV